MRHHALERPAIGTLGLLVVASACSSAEGTPTGTDAGGSIDATTFDAVVPDAGAESGLDSAPDVTGDESIADAPSDVADAGVCTTIALDPTFGTTGEVSTLPAPVGPILVQQADGKLLVIGSAQSIIMVRFATDGHVDTTFGTAGVATTTVSGTIRGAAVQPDGKFVLAGCTTTTTNSVILMRVNADGTPDTTFGSNGSAQPPVASGCLNSLLMLPDGSMAVAGGQEGTPQGSTMIVAEYDTTGALASSFGTGGLVKPITTANTVATAMALQPDGNIVVGGEASAATDAGRQIDFALVRLTPTGSLDSSFGTSGVVRTSFGTGQNYLDALALQPDGKIVAAGQPNGLSPDYVTLRYAANGAVDTTFGTQGVASTIFYGLGSAPEAVFVTPGGDILLVGEVTTQGSAGVGIGLAALRPDGTPDAQFGAKGTLLTTFPSSTSDFPSSAILQSDGRLAVACNGRPPPDAGISQDLELVRYTCP